MFLGFEFHRFVGKVFLLGGKFWAYFEDQLSQIMTEKDQLDALRIGMFQLYDSNSWLMIKNSFNFSIQNLSLSRIFLYR